MTPQNPLTQSEIDYILKAKEQHVPNKKIAETLGRSIRVVQKYAAKYRKRETTVKDALKELPGVSYAVPFREGERQNTTARLREERNLLRESLLTAETRNIATIAKEYRAVCMQIEELEGAKVDDKQDRTDDPLERSLKLVVGS